MRSHPESSSSHGTRPVALSRALAVFIFTLCLIICQWPATADAATSSIKIPGGGQVLLKADNLVRDFDKGTLEMTGNVQILYNGQFVSCDNALINEKSGEMVLNGGLVMASTQAYIEGDSAVVNYRTNTGTFVNGFVKSGQVLFQGKVIRKTGESNYEAEDANFTACTTCPAAWSFRGTQVKAQLGGYAFIKHSLIEVANFPVLWLPYLIVPLKSERQSGLLVPVFEFGRNFALGLPYFWAISRSQDAMFTVKSYTLRGIKGLLNYRYMLNETSEGELNFGTIHDQSFANDLHAVGIDAGSKVNRWFLTFENRYDLPDDFTQKTKLNLVSDVRYPRDFPMELVGQGDAALDNRFSLARNTEQTHASAQIDYYIDQLKANPIDSNKDAVHRWPELRYALRERPLFGTDLLFDFNTDYVNFARDGLAYDDVIVDANGNKVLDVNHQLTGATAGSPGAFDKGLDIIRAGQRLDLAPELSYPFRAGKYFDVLPVVQFRHTQYSLNLSPPVKAGEPSFDPTPYRQYVRGQISARTRFFHVFGRSEEPQSHVPISNPLSSWTDRESEGEKDQLKAPPKPPDLYRHEIRPEVIFSSVPYFQQTSSEFFGQASNVPAFLDTQPLSNVDFTGGRGIQFDYEDRVTNRNTLSLVVNNRLVRKSFAGTTLDYRQVGNFQFGQTYDIDESKKAEQPKYPWSDIFALLDVRLENFETNTLVRYFPYHGVTNTLARVRFMRGAKYFETLFSQQFTITPDIDAASATRTDDLQFNIGYTLRYFDVIALIDFQPRGEHLRDYTVKSYGTQFDIKPPGNCWGIKLRFEQRLADELRAYLSFDYKFGGETG